MAESILVGPTHLSFSSTEPTQRCDIYNMNPNTVHYIVQSTGPDRYLVTPREGSILPNCKVSMEITHRDICVTNENQRDIIRITFTVIRNKKKEVLCYKEVNVVLCSSHRRTSSSRQQQSGDSLSAHSTSSLPGTTSSPYRRSSRLKPQTSTDSGVESFRRVDSSPAPAEMQAYNLLFFLVPLLVCFAVAWMPEPGTVPGMPWYLQFSVSTQKAVMYVAGIFSTLLYWQVMLRNFR